MGILPSERGRERERERERERLTDVAQINARLPLLPRLLCSYCLPRWWRPNFALAPRKQICHEQRLPAGLSCATSLREPQELLSRCVLEFYSTDTHARTPIQDILTKIKRIENYTVTSGSVRVESLNFCHLTSVGACFVLPGYSWRSQLIVFASQQSAFLVLFVGHFE